MIKKTFIFILFIISLLSFKNNVLAIYIPGSEVGDSSGGYTVVSSGNCVAFTSATCNRLSSSSDCGICGSTSSDCCSESPNWTKNKKICVKYVVYGGIGSPKTKYVTAWGNYSNQCSLADKQIGTEPGLRPATSDCACNSYGPSIYKYCCDSAGYPEQPIMSWSDDDGVYPPEKDCPGGYAIDGNRVRSVPCTPNCVPNCNGDSRYLQTCDHNTFVGNCGQTCYGSMGTDCRNSGDYCVGTQGLSINRCDMCDGTKPVVTGTSGSCGSDNGGTFTTTPTNLCTSGTASAVTVGATTYGWTCSGTAGDCGGANGSTANCSATRNVPPTFSSITVKNNSGTTVVAESGNVNQICQNEFNGVRTVNLTVNANDPNGAGTISDIQLRWNGINFTRTGLANGVANFSHTFAAGENTTGAVDFQVYISDGTNNTGWITTGRSLKVWNCNVAVSGRLYDGGASGNCNVGGDYVNVARATNFTTLDYNDSPTMNMSRVSESEYNGNLTWGKTYTAIFNSDIAMQILGSGVKTTDVSSGTSYCPGSVAFTLNNSVINPYSSSPTLRVDFSGVVDQDGWYQAVGGGLMANNVLTNRVPITCTTANCAMSINGTNGINGIIASKVINNTGNSDAKKGNPNNWSVTKPLVSNVKSDYNYFLNQYFWEKGIGTTLNGDKNISDIGTTGVYFINGNLNVTANNSVPVGSFLMVLASGNITVDPSVTNLEGIFVSNNMDIGGSNATALLIKGTIKTSQNMKISRTFVNKRTNNTTPAVNFIYRPDFIFNMPGEIARQLVKWQWGN